MTNKAFAIVKELEDRGENKMTNEMTTKNEKNMTTETIETISEEFGTEVIKKDYCLPSTEVIEKIEKALKENNATFYRGWTSFEELEKDRCTIDLSRPTICIVGNDENEIYYMDIVDLDNLSSDIKYFLDKVLSYEGTLNPSFEKVELTFSNPEEDFRAVSCIESYEIKRD